ASVYPRLPETTVWTCSSAGEHLVDIEGVTGSIPVTSTISPNPRRPASLGPRPLRQGGDLGRGQLVQGLHRAALAAEAGGVADDVDVERIADAAAGPAAGAQGDALVPVDVRAGDQQIHPVDVARAHPDVD